jgi:hypothetical protein
VEDTENLFRWLHRLNQGLDTEQWRIMSARRNSVGTDLCSALIRHVAALERMDWKPFSGKGQAIFSLVGAKPEGKK